MPKEEQNQVLWLNLEKATLIASDYGAITSICILR